MKIKSDFNSPQIQFSIYIYTLHIFLECRLKTISDKRLRLLASSSADKRLHQKSYFRLLKRLLIDTQSNADRVAKQVSDIGKVTES